MRPRCLGQQYAAILGNVLGRNFREVDLDCLFGGTAGLAHVLHYPVEHLALLLVGPSVPDIGSNPYLIRLPRSTGASIAKLEEELWGKLFHRSPKSGTLTPAGRR